MRFTHQMHQTAVLDSHAIGSICQSDSNTRTRGESIMTVTTVATMVLCTCIDVDTSVFTICCTLSH